jgi:ribonuclease HII
VSKLVLGIDEAGRGPSIGPLVLAAVALDAPAARRLTRAGVMDSKRFGSGDEAHARRCELHELIRRHATFVDVEICSVEAVDAYVAVGGLNELERQRADRLIARAPVCGRIIADGRRLFAAMRARHPQLEARDRAESLHVSVAAASVAAKVRRDELFAAIAARYAEALGPITGGGYANAATRSFVKRYVRAYGVLPPEARRSWPWKGLRLPPDALALRPTDEAPAQAQLNLFG